MPTQYFSNATFRFLTDLEANNDRVWFNANKDRFLRNVQEPALQFINDFGPRLRKVSAHFLADPRPVGGSLYRIYRDTRFSKDKTPYKTHLAMNFRHESMGDVHTPGFYLHIQPGACYAGMGLWRPHAPVAQKIRQAILDDPNAWKKASRGKAFAATWNIDGDSLIRPPKGIDPDHPYIEDLKRKDFTAGARLSQKQVLSPEFIDEYARMCKAASPFMAFLCEATGVPF
jgi:uncharacterized protein (TIGR02453 family)